MKQFAKIDVVRAKLVLLGSLINMTNIVPPLRGKLLEKVIEIKILSALSKKVWKMKLENHQKPFAKLRSLTVLVTVDTTQKIYACKHVIVKQ